MVKLGELSFAFYMGHLLVLRTGEYLFDTYHPYLPVLPALGVTAAAFTACPAAAWLLYEGVERPCRRLRLYRRRARRPAETPSAAAGTR